MDIFNCRSFDPDPPASYLIDDLRIECNTDNYFQWIFTLIPFIVLYFLILPFFTLGTVMKFIKVYSKEECMKYLGFLLIGFGFEKFYW